MLSSPLPYLLLIFSQATSVASPLRVALVSEGESVRGGTAAQELQVELEKLIEGREIVIDPVALSTLEDEGALEEIYAGRDLVVAWGLLASNRLGRLRPLPRPTLLSLVPQPDLLGLEVQSEGGSGVPGLSYLRPPRTVADELRSFHELFAFSHVALLVSERLKERTALAERLAEASRSPDFQTTIVWIEEGASAHPKLPEGVDAVFVGPLGPRRPANRLGPWVEEWTARGLTSYSVLGRQLEELQTAAGTSLGVSRQTMLRRIALDISKIVDGARPETLAVELTDLQPQPVLNLALLRRLGRVPTWEVLYRASLVKVDLESGAQPLELRQTILLALERNLSLQVRRISARAGEHEVAAARGALLPQVNFSTGIEAIDGDTSAATRGARTPLVWAGQIGLSQVLLAEPLWANLSIQRLIARTRQLVANQSELDTILATSEAYLGVLLAQATARIENRNVEVTRQNARIARRRLEAGAMTRTDLARWESQLALETAELHQALAVLQAARYRLNQLLDLPQTTPHELVELRGPQVAALPAEEAFRGLIDDPGRLERFADFLLTEALLRLPQLQQLRLAIEVQERLLKSQRRALYLPRVTARGALSQTLLRYGEVELPAGVSPAVPTTGPSWAIGLDLGLPLYEGGVQARQGKRTAVELASLQRQRKELESQLELRLRSQLQLVGAAHTRIGLAEIATRAARASLEDAQRAYGEGQIPVSQLIDAQQAALQARHAAAGAGYQFILEFLRVERAVGFYYFLLDSDERRATLERARRFMGEAR